MRFYKREEGARLKKDAIITISKFLMKLGQVSHVEKRPGGQDHIDLVTTQDRNGEQEKLDTITVMAERAKNENLFFQTFVTEVKGCCILSATPGWTLQAKSNFIYYLVGSKLYILPTKPFTLWVDREMESFRAETYLLKDGQGGERHFHGVMVPLSRIERDFAKGNPMVCVYQLKDNPNSDTEIDFIQEL